VFGRPDSISDVRKTLATEVEELRRACFGGGRGGSSRRHKMVEVVESEHDATGSA
jgi:hypothetical protein